MASALEKLQKKKNDNMSILNAIEHLAELEDKIEQGTLKEIPEGSVVLTKEELEEMKFTQKYCDLYKENERLRKSLSFIRKGTVKEIFDWLKSEVIMTEIPHGGEPSEEDVEAVMWWQIEEHFKKRYGVEVK